MKRKSTLSPPLWAVVILSTAMVYLSFSVSVSSAKLKGVLYFSSALAMPRSFPAVISSLVSDFFSRTAEEPGIKSEDEEIIIQKFGNLTEIDEEESDIYFTGDA
ncbi:MAG: hypothetical protein LUH40_07465 [Clostridiales bacterium]|nr:hypothetical protein [Clostridiales bacterium]